MHLVLLPKDKCNSIMPLKNLNLINEQKLYYLTYNGNFLFLTQFSYSYRLLTRILPDLPIKTLYKITIPAVVVDCLTTYCKKVINLILNSIVIS